MSSVKNEETIVYVPKRIAEMPLGFVIDAGGSVSKLIYRSKDDYSNGKPRMESDASVGKLRLRYFHLGSGDEVFEFIQKNCDIMESCRKDTDREWLQTGFHAQFIQERMKKSYGVKIKLQSEFIAIMKCVKDIFCHNMIPEFSKFLPHSIDAVRIGLEHGRALFDSVKAFASTGDNTFTKTKPSQFFEKQIKKLTTLGPEEWLEELNGQKLEFPCIVCNLGSGGLAHMMYEDGRYTSCYLDTIAGKTVLALAKTLTGAKDFDDFIEMASRGDKSKVDTTSDELKAGAGNSDWYSAIPDHVTVFNLGKLADNNNQAGSHTKDDLAAGILHYHCQMFTNTALLNARIHRIKSVVFIGSFVAHPKVREIMLLRFLENSTMQLFQGMEEEVKIHFLPNSGFICALGIWLQNLETSKLDNGKEGDSS